MSEAVSPSVADVDLSQYPGLRVLREVASYLAVGIGTDDVFAGIIGALGRGVGATECRIWVRTPDGSAFRAFVAGGEDEPNQLEAARAARWVGEGEAAEAQGDLLHVRAPLVHA